MSIVNVKIIFAKKQKQTCEKAKADTRTPNSRQGGGGRVINHDRNGCFPTTDGCEISYPFDNSRQIGNTS